MKEANNFKGLLFLLLIVFLLVSSYFLVDLFKEAESLLKRQSLGPLIYILLMTVSILFVPIPSSPLVIIAGAIFGPLLGMVYTLVGATLGATIAFLLARFFLYDSLGKKIAASSFYKKIKGKNNKNIVWVVFLTRLMPQVSFDLVSYAAGLTSVNILAFAGATFLGMIPMVFLLSFFGKFIEPYLIYFLAFLTTVFIVLILYKIIKHKKKGNEG